MQELLALAIMAAESAGVVLRERLGKVVEISRKSSAIDLVTDADKAAEQVILSLIGGRCPDHGILAEESGLRPGTDYLWIVDPLDGTTNFAHGFPHFAVSIGLYRDGQPMLGVIHDPLRRESFFASRGQGAFLQSDSGRRKLVVTAVEDLQSALLATGFAYGRERTRSSNVAEFSRVVVAVRGLRRAGSAALDLAYVAAGRLDGFWEFDLSPWDTAAGALLVQEAGGEVCCIAPELAWDYEQPSIVAAGREILPRMLEVLRG